MRVCRHRWERDLWHGSALAILLLAAAAATSVHTLAGATARCLAFGSAAGIGSEPLPVVILTSLATGAAVVAGVFVLSYRHPVANVVLVASLAIAANLFVFEAASAAGTLGADAVALALPAPLLITAAAAGRRAARPRQPARSCAESVPDHGSFRPKLR